jgi:hypothetical protein
MPPVISFESYKFSSFSASGKTSAITIVNLSPHATSMHLLFSKKDIGQTLSLFFPSPNPRHPSVPSPQPYNLPF